MNIWVNQRQTFDLNVNRFSVPPKDFFYLLFPDSTYNAQAPLSILKANVLDKLSRRNESLHSTVTDVITEFREIVKIEEISHLVLYGRNRVRVLVDIINCDCMPQNIPIVLSSNEIAKIENIKQQHSPGVLICPYQIDTDRYPFIYKF